MQRRARPRPGAAEQAPLPADSPDVVPGMYRSGRPLAGGVGLAVLLSVLLFWAPLAFLIARWLRQ